MSDMLQYLKPSARTLARAWLGVALAAALAAWLLFVAEQQHRDAQRTAQQTERLRVAQAQKPPPKPSRSEQEQQKRWEAYKVERAFTWVPLLVAVERAATADIELLEFQPDKASRRVFLHGEARDEKALTAFLETLSEQAGLKNVHLTHQQNTERERMHTVEFEIKATLSD